MKIAIDGPGGAGKSTLARAVAAKLSLVYLDTGALYRAVGLAMLNRGIRPDDAAAVIATLPTLSPELKYLDGAQHVYIDNDDVTAKIRTPEVSDAASKVSAIPEVRSLLSELQQSMARRGNVIIDGRDIGTVIMPDADFKLFLTATPEARATRRYKELEIRGTPQSYEDILRDINERDGRDASRSIAPAIPASDAVLFDNSELNFEQSVDAVLAMIKEKGLL